MLLVFLVAGRLSALTTSTKEEVSRYTDDVTYSVFIPEDRKIKNLFSASEEAVIKSSGSETATDTRIKLPLTIPFNDIAGKKIIYPSVNTYKTVKIAKGDTLYSLAKKYKTTSARIKKANHLKSDQVQIEDSIKIPVISRSGKPREVIYKKIYIYPVAIARLTSTYGRRRNPFNRYTRHFHAGIDLAGSVGTPAMAAAGGTVEFAGRNGGYGNTVIILHESGIKTVYAHLARITVKPGETVKMGAVVGAIGRTGVATAAHLHFAVMKNGRFINPVIILNQRKTIVRELQAAKIAGL